MANSVFFGALGLPETDEALIQRVGERIVHEAAEVSLGSHNAQVAGSLDFILENTIEDWKITYKYAGGGRLQKLGNRSRAAEIKGGFSWDVGLPLENLAAGFSADRVTYAYMSVRDFDRVLTTVQNQNTYTIRDEMLKALFNNTTRVFKDDLRGDINVRPLANGDAVVYPPLVGTEVPGTSNSYLGVATDATAFTDANSPILTAVALLESRFGIPSGGSPIVTFLNSVQAKRAKLLADYEPVINRYVTPGVAVSQVELSNLPPLPGRVFGVANGSILSEWPFIPAGYTFSLHLGAPKPLLERVDMGKVNLPRGLQLVSEEIDHPFYRAEWVHRTGFGVGNRLNGVLQDLTAAGGANVYTIPPQWV